MKKEYEMIREIFNNCSGNQMRDVDIRTVETDDVEEFVRIYLDDPEAVVERQVSRDGAVVFEVEKAGLRQRFSFTEA
ncbi:MAG: hypothetical protein LBR44_05555 [Clostridiales Family XIII bacterium]|jgi:hypothetical protein|nr:hypothetical protein [Clostridiales Family XIII bacterium]